MKKVYISGPMSGIDKDVCRRMFEEAENEVIDLFGYRPVNPIYLEGAFPGLTYDDYIAIDKTLIDRCDAIYMLRGWEASWGGKNREGLR